MGKPSSTVLLASICVISALAVGSAAAAQSEPKPAEPPSAESPKTPEAPKAPEAPKTPEAPKAPEGGEADSEKTGDQEKKTDTKTEPSADTSAEPAPEADKETPPETTSEEQAEADAQPPPTPAEEPSPPTPPSDAPKPATAAPEQEAKPQERATVPEQAEPIPDEPDKVTPSERTYWAEGDKAIHDYCATGMPAATDPFGEAPRGPRTALDAEIGFSAPSEGDSSALWLSPLLKGWFRIFEMFELALAWGFVGGTAYPGNDDTQSTFRVGNPYVTASSVRLHGCTTLRVGLGATIPLASLKDTDDTTGKDAFTGAMAMRGMWEWWLWVPNSLNFVLPIEWETVVSQHLFWGGTIALAGTGILKGGDAAFLSDDPKRGHLAVPLGLKVGFRTGRFLLGAALNSVHFLTADTESQLSLAPSVRVNLGSGHILTRLTVNLDEPYGFSFKEGGHWGMYLGGGVTF